MEKYSLEKLQEEAVAMQNKVKNNETKNYSEAASQIENKRNVLEDFKFDITEPLKDKEQEITGRGFSTVYLDSFSHKITGFAGESYIFRDNKDELEYYQPKKMKEEDIDPWQNFHIQYRPEEQDLELKEKIEKLIKDKIVLELGSGKNGDGYIISDYLGAKGYIGTEMLYPESAYLQIENFKGETPYFMVQGDFVEYINKLKENKKKVGVIIMTGIDLSSYQGEKPLSEVLNIVNDCLEDNGIIITDRPDIFENNYKIIESVNCSEFNSITILQKDKNIKEKNINTQGVELTPNKNSDIERPYLKEGLEKWLEEINNYWQNKEYYKKIEGEINQSEILIQKLLEKIQNGQAIVFHREMTDLGSTLMMYNEIKKKQNELKITYPNFPEFDYNLFADVAKKIFKRLEGKPQEDEIKNKPLPYHPLIKPFEEKINKLKKQGITELPEDISEQAILVGMSTAYENGWSILKKFENYLIDYQDKLKEFIEKHKFENPPKIPTYNKGYFLLRKERDYRMYGTGDYEKAKKEREEYDNEKKQYLPALRKKIHNNRTKNE